MLAVEEISNEAYRSLFATSIGFNGGKKEDIENVLPDWFQINTLTLPPIVAQGLLAAMRDGLVHGDMYHKWPAMLDKTPLIRVWDKITQLAEG